MVWADFNKTIFFHKTVAILDNGVSIVFNVDVGEPAWKKMLCYSFKCNITWESVILCILSNNNPNAH